MTVLHAGWGDVLTDGIGHLTMEHDNRMDHCREGPGDVAAGAGDCSRPDAVAVTVDTNILMRSLTRDDRPQARAAAWLIECGAMLAISNVMLRELVWVLRRTRRHTATARAKTLYDIVPSRDVARDRPTVEPGGAFMLHFSIYYVDGIVQHDAGRARSHHIAAFDRKVAKLLAMLIWSLDSFAAATVDHGASRRQKSATKPRWSTLNRCSVMTGRSPLQRQAKMVSWPVA